MNILCEFEVPFKGESKKCKLTMRSLIRAQSELSMSGIKELGEALENLNVVAAYAIIAACLDCDKEELYDEDINIIPMCLEFLGSIIEACTVKKKVPSKKKKK